MDNTTQENIERTFWSVRRKYNINTKHLTESDFYRICERESIFVSTKEFLEENNLPLIEMEGTYIFCLERGFKMIYLSSIAKGGFDAFIAYHELGHHFCNHKGDVLAYTVTDENYHEQSKEKEADYFAKLATGLARGRK